MSVRTGLVSTRSHPGPGFRFSQPPEKFIGESVRQGIVDEKARIEGIIQINPDDLFTLAKSGPGRWPAAAANRPGKLPWRAGKLPGFLGKLLRAAGKLPRAAGQLPGTAGQLPGAAGQLPGAAGKLPESFGSYR